MVLTECHLENKLDYNPSSFILCRYIMTHISYTKKKSNVLIVLFIDQLHKHDEFKACVEHGYFRLALCFRMTSHH